MENKELVEYMRAIAICNAEACTCDLCPFLTYRDKCDLVRFSEFSKIVEG